MTERLALEAQLDQLVGTPYEWKRVGRYRLHSFIVQRTVGHLVETLFLQFTKTGRVKSAEYRANDHETNRSRATDLFGYRDRLKFGRAYAMIHRTDQHDAETVRADWRAYGMTPANGDAFVAGLDGHTLFRMAQEIHANAPRRAYAPV